MAVSTPVLNKGSFTTDQTNPALPTGSLGRLVSTLYPALEDDSIAGDKAEVLCPCPGHLDTPPPPSMKGASSEYIYRGGSWSEASEDFKTWPGHEER